MKILGSKLLLGLLSLLLVITLLGGYFILFDKGVQVGERVIRIGTTAEAVGTADYTCDGIADDVQWNAALTALPATGGKIYIYGGHYVFASLVTKVSDNVTIEGVGRGTYVTRDGASTLITAGGNNWVISNLRTDTGGINMAATTGWSWENITINTTYYAYRTDDATTASSWNIPTGRSSTVIIATSDATAAEKAQADIVLTGTQATGGDDVPIEASIAANPNKSFYITPGTVWLSHKIDTTTKFKLTGAGMGLTYIKPADGFADSMLFDINSLAATFEISNISFHGRLADGIQTGALYIHGNSHPDYIEKCYFNSFHYNVIYMDNIDFLQIQNNYTSGGLGNSMPGAPEVINGTIAARSTAFLWLLDNQLLSLSAYPTLSCSYFVESLVRGNDFEGNGGGASFIYIKSAGGPVSNANNVFSNNKFQYGTGSSIYMETGKNIVINDNWFTWFQGGASTEVFLQNIDTLTMTGNVMWGADGAGHNQNYALTASNVSNAVFSKNVMTGYLVSPPISITSSPTLNIIDNPGYVSLPEEYPMIERVLDVLGTDTRALWAFTNTSGTAITDYGTLSHNLTATETLNTFNTKPSSQYKMRYQTTNGTDEGYEIASHADFIFGNILVDTPFSVVVWTDPTGNWGASDAIIQKASSGAGIEIQQDWYLNTDASGYINFGMYDQSATGLIRRWWAGTTTPTDVTQIVGTYDGSATSAGIKIYSNTTRVDDNGSDAAYTAMEGNTAPVTIGYRYGAGGAKGNFYPGRFYLVAITGKVLTATDIKRLDLLKNAWLGKN